MSVATTNLRPMWKDYTMININKGLLLITISGLSCHAHSAGFDCAKASSAVEKMICADTQLSVLDSSLKNAYQQALSNTATPADLKTEQQYWLQEVRDACKDNACLTRVYHLRLDQLNAGGISGEYQRDSAPHTATINVQPVEYQQFHITGNAVWVGNAETGNVNIGELDSLAPLEANTLQYSSGNDEFACKLTLNFAKQALTVSGDNGNCGGHNVSFDGLYKKSK